MNTILTFGYSGKKFENLLKVVRDCDCIVYDVRLVPLSRFKPEWSKKNLASALSQQYIHADGLGNLNYKGGPVKLKNQGPWLKKISDELKFRSVLLLCSCRDFSLCHRSIIAADVSRETGCKILNL